MTAGGTLLPRANAAACLQLAKADFASSSQHVRERQRIAALHDMLVETTPEPLAVRARSPVGAARPVTMRVSRHGSLTALVDQCPHSVEGDMRR
jgi:hypothetical protein